MKHAFFYLHTSILFKLKLPLVWYLDFPNIIIILIYLKYIGTGVWALFALLIIFTTANSGMEV